jgi:hypothetical protein
MPSLQIHLVTIRKRILPLHMQEVFSFYNFLTSFVQILSFLALFIIKLTFYFNQQHIFTL